MHVRTPDIQPDDGPMAWAHVPEFSAAYNGYSVVIPYVEYYLNSIMNRVRKEHCADDPALAETIATFVKQETHHSKYHERFNRRMFDADIDGLKALVEQVVTDLRTLRQTRPLAFNVAYCAGFECIATFDAIYLHTCCDEFFEGADPRGANLLLWHVAEEFEHRAVCHDAFHAVSGNWLTRMHGLFYAFFHVGSAFLRSEALVLAHLQKGMSEDEKRASTRRSKKLFWRQIRYVAPRMPRILLPWYDPSKLPVPPRIQAALDRFRSDERFDRPVLGLA